MPADCLQRLVGHIFRMTRRKADTHVRHRIGYQLQKVGEVNIPVFIRVDVLAEEGNLFVSFRLQVPYLIEDGLHIAAAFPAAGIRHHAVGAEIIAPAHDGHESANRTADTRRDDLAVGLRRAEFHVHRLMSLLTLRKEVGDIQIGIRACDKIHAEGINQLLTHSLCHATDNTDNRAAIIDGRFRI